ncbi:hypothetical protein BD410DRAFT_846223 [Rickenella mellea]|uniref:Uncharacterized protein n=1 Tax=Rickenella mellea TaxID=50990 RepID=A0A4Y7PFQ9_9AGAM|nr:hypothetical protein BD410DRAFT_846223 [Rickenella mellea]
MPNIRDIMERAITPSPQRPEAPAQQPLFMPDASGVSADDIVSATPSAYTFPTDMDATIFAPANDLDAFSDPFHVSRKRRGDLEQYVDAIAAAKKLKTDQAFELRRFSKASVEEREVLQYAVLLQVRDTANTRSNEGVTAFRIPNELKKNIDKYTMQILLSPVLLAYWGETPVNILLMLIKKNMWGLTERDKEDASRWQVVCSAVRNQIVQRRSDIKGHISKSLRLDNPLCRSLTIVELATGLSTMVKTSEITVTVEMLARIALLRSVLEERTDDKYWQIVDKALREVRARSVRENIPVRKIIAGFLTSDIERHHNPEIGQLQVVAQSGSQFETDKLVGMAKESSRDPSADAE